MGKRLLLLMVFVLCLTSLSIAGYPASVTVLEKAEIAKLNDEQVVDAYQDAIVEIEASRSFHTTSGFSPKEYKEYKSLLKYRLLLAAEIHSRNLETPQF